MGGVSYREVCLQDEQSPIFTETYDVLRRRANRTVPIKETSKRKRVDDDLPRIAEAYQEYLLTGEVPA